MCTTSSQDPARTNGRAGLQYVDSRNARHGERRRPHGILARSPALCETLVRLERVASTDATVLITGETGTGKELVARAVHQLSRRRARPLVTANLAAIPEALVSSELFGHEPGAFTGAAQRRIGRFELADNATLFLDEVGDLSNDVQVSLLRVLQEGEFARLGSSLTKRADVRVVAATNRALDREVSARRFRADLYYRLSVFPIHLPPLRERTQDIPALVGHFLRDIERRVGRQFSGIERSSVERMRAFSWPGNVRQLENVVEQSAILCDGPLLEVPASLLQEPTPIVPVSSRLDAILETAEQQMIEEALAVAEGRVSGRSGAAERLGVPASTLEAKIRRYGINKHRYRTIHS